MYGEVLIGGIYEGYICAFVDYLMNSNENQLNIRVIDREKDLKEAIESEVYDLLIFDAFFYETLNPDIIKGEEDRVIILTEPVTPSHPLVEMSLMKYQSMRSIEKILLSKLAESDTRELVHAKQKDTTVMAVYSPYGGLGVSSIAQVTAMVEAEKGKKVLYLSLDRYHKESLYFQGEVHFNFSDLLVRLLSSKSWMMGIQQMVTVDTVTGIHYFEGANHEEDLCDISSELVVDLLSCLRERSVYEAVVIDLGQRHIKLIADVMGIVDKHIYITGSDRNTEGKWYKYMADIAALGYEGDESKTIRFYRQYENRMTAVYREGYTPLPYDPGMFKKNKSDTIRINPQSDSYMVIKGALSYGS